MTGQRVKSQKTRRSGWQFRYTDPATGRRRKKTIWIREKREAERAMGLYLEERESCAVGLPDSRGWKMPYDELVAKFIKGASISTDRRRQQLKRWLDENPLRLHSVAELNIGSLAPGCRHLISEDRSESWVYEHVHRALKQMTRWAAEVRLLPYDPLSPWRRLPRQEPVRRRRAYTPEMARAVLNASREYDDLFGRRFPSDIPLKALLYTGNRPEVVLGAKVGDVDWETSRIVLPPGNGNKRNGRAHLPRAFLMELRSYLARRGSPGPDESLFVSSEGEPIERLKTSKNFTRALILALVRKQWPVGDPRTLLVEPVEVAHRIHSGRVRGFDGPPPRDPAKRDVRQCKVEAIESLAAELEPQVNRHRKGRDMYALKATHVSWARRLVSVDSVKVQVGHAPSDVEERHYLDFDLVDARESAEAVYDVLMGKRELTSGRQAAIDKLAVGAEFMASEVTKSAKSGPIVVPIGEKLGSAEPTAAKKSPATSGGAKSCIGAGDGARTHGLDLGKVGSRSAHICP